MNPVLFWEKVGPPDRTLSDDECWEWQACRDPGGYGVIRFSGTGKKAHRIAYELTVGPVPDGSELDHLCSNRACVNPGHLEPVTRAENVRRAGAKGVYAATSFNGAKTHCFLGHPFDAVNTYVSQARPNKRECRKCNARLQRELRARRAEARRGL